MSLVLVRYAEMGLKSRPVRQRFENMLLENMLEALGSRGVEALISSDHSRIYVQVDDEGSAIEVLSRVFGVASLSPVVECGAEMAEIGRTAAEMSLPLIGMGDSFAVRARRDGVHAFTSLDLNREVGSAIWMANDGKGVSVDLKDPNVEIFVEVRGSRAFVFHRTIAGPGGLPLGSQGKVLAVVHERKDILAAWLMMKRGCRVAVVTGDPSLVEGLMNWDVNLRVESPANTSYMRERWGALATVYGHTSWEMDRTLWTDPELPVFFPLIGMDEGEIERRLAAIES